MFSKPTNGWVDISINGINLGTASYLTDVPIDTLETFYSYLCGDISNFELVYDAEGYSFGLTEINYGIYGFNDQFEKIELTEDLCGDISTYEFIRHLAKEAVEDIENNFLDWINFSCHDSEYEDTTIEKELQDIIKAIRPYLDPNYDMEIGNLLFGNSRGAYPIPRNMGFEEEFDRLLDCGFDMYGYIEDDKLEKYLKTKTSKFSPKEIYGSEVSNFNPHIHYFDNGTFMINPYYWGDYTDLADLPNFIYYPDNLEISWYKYRFRDAYSSKELTLDYFKKIIDKCIESLKES